DQGVPAERVQVWGSAGRDVGERTAPLVVDADVVLTQAVEDQDDEIHGLPSAVQAGYSLRRGTRRSPASRREVGSNSTRWRAAMARTDFKTVDEYIASRPQAVRGVLGRLRSIIRKALPGADEVISCQIPAYKLHGATGRVVEVFKDELEP